MRYTPYNYQLHAEEHAMANPYAGLFLDMGLGKTAITLTVINRLLFDTFEISRVLVVAPTRVAKFTWSAEVEKWDHLRHLRVSKVLGTESQRKKALYAKSDIYVINRENLAWLIGFYGTKWPFDMVVIDELSSFKAPDAIRFRQFKKVRPFCKRVLGLTGTPGQLIDLWAQLYCLDQGERLGKTITSYRENYFRPDKRKGMVVYSYELKNEQYKQEIFNKIGDICISMKSEDYLELPELVDQYTDVYLGEEVTAKYLRFEQEQIMQMDTGEEITALNAAALTGKLMQFANGAVYGADKSTWHDMHEAKLEALDDIIEAANGKPVLVFYWFKHDLARLQARYKGLKPRQLNNEADVNDWNAGKIPLLLLQPQSAGHGLNLQAGGNIIVWFGLTWSLELYQQAKKRLHRQGQQHVVMNYHLIAKGTIDEQAIEALRRKEAGQDAIINAVKALVAKHRK